MSQRRLPAEIYWRRRLLVLAMLIGLVWLGVQLWPGGGDERPVSSPAPSATPSATPTPEPEPTDGTTTVSLASDDATCNPETIRITPSVPSGQRAREPVRMQLTVSTSSTKPCTFTAQSSDMLVVISAGKTAIWDSTVCKTALIDEPVQLSPGWSTVVPVEWSGRGSGPACSSKEGWATPGRYVVKLGTLGGEPGQAKFTLEQPKKKPKPDEDDEKKDESDEKKSDERKSGAKKKSEDEKKDEKKRD